MAYDVTGLTTKVRRRVRDNTVDSNTILEYLNDTQREIFNRFNLPQMETVFTGTLATGIHTYEYRPDHQATIDLIIIDPDNNQSSWSLIDRFIPYRDFDKIYPNPETNSNSAPYIWTEGPGGPNVHTKQMFFSAPVDKDYIMRGKYIRTPAELVNITDIPELPEEYQELLVIGAASRVQEIRDKWDEAALLQNKLEDLLTDLVLRQAQGQRGRAHKVRTDRRAVSWGW